MAGAAPIRDQNKSRYSYKIGGHTVQLYLQTSPMYSKMSYGNYDYF